MFNYLKKDRWSPYIVGIGFGLLLVILLKFDTGLGTCSGITKLAALISYAVAPKFTLDSSYFGLVLKNQPIFDWKLLFIFGIFLGALVSSKLSLVIPSFFKSETVWVRRFGSSKIKRHAGIFFGSIILMYGMRVAGGCLTGHGLQGLSQLSLGSLVFVISSSICAIASAFFIYRFKRKV